MLPKEFELSQNYPNPFNPSTTFQFQIPEQNFVTLKIYDIIGNEVATIVNMQLPSRQLQIPMECKQVSKRSLHLQITSGKFC